MISKVFIIITFLFVIVNCQFLEIDLDFEFENRCEREDNQFTNCLTFSDAIDIDYSEYTCSKNNCYGKYDHTGAKINGISVGVILDPNNKDKIYECSDILKKACKTFIDFGGKECVAAGNPYQFRKCSKE